MNEAREQNYPKGLHFTAQPRQDVRIADVVIFRGEGEGLSMTVAELEQRVQVLEQTVQRLQQRVEGGPSSAGQWWVESAGRFADGPVFEEIVRLGRMYRDSLRPKRRKVQRAHP